MTHQESQQTSRINSMNLFFANSQKQEVNQLQEKEEKIDGNKLESFMKEITARLGNIEDYLLQKEKIQPDVQQKEKKI